MAAVLDEEQALWLRDGAPSIAVASCDAQGVSSLAQGIGIAVSPARDRLRVLMIEARSRALVADLRAGRAVAVVFTHAPTLRSLQLKAARAREVPLDPGDRALIDGYVDTVERNWTYAPPGFVRTLLAKDSGDFVAFEVEPTSAFDQTPGPKAGAALPGNKR